MGEVGESSGTRHSEEIWAKLVPSDSGYSEVVLSSDEIVICSEIKSSGLDKRKWCKISRNPDLCCATIQNMSPNAILVNEVVVENEDTIVIKCGSEIIAGPDREGYLSYKFEVMPGPEICKKQVKIAIDADDAKCSICLNIWHDVVTVAPCLHNFCNGCFSEWLRRSQEKHSRVLCPHCRAVVQFIGRNHFLHKIVEDVIEADSSLKRSDEEVALLDSYASIKSNLVIKSRKNLSRKRAHSLVDEESDGIDLSCLQCDTELGGFHCNENTVHLQCQGCGGIMPSRSDIGVPQHCVGCDRTFCGAYWHAQRLTTSEFYPICSHETFVPISDRTISRLPDAVHERNRHEQDITERCIIQMGRTLQDVISDWTAKLDNREIDRTNMPLKHAEMVSAATHVCNGCYEKLVSFLLYWFRISLPKSLLPPDASKREDCWYGYACRTQHHSEEHARKRNHVCRPTRGY